jgi:8-oxo-dGTP pyrophosphatase MutT (NUDIX family)
MIVLDTCPRCGAIGCVDCPGQDSGKWCDHQCVGAFIRNDAGETLLFKRATFPFAIAGPAGHCDGDPADLAVIKEVQEEIGLEVVYQELLTQFWHKARCRRRFASTPGHYWQFFKCLVRGELHASVRETQPDSLRWHSSAEVVQLLNQTRAYLDGKMDCEHLDLPWYIIILQMMTNGIW